MAPEAYDAPRSRDRATDVFSFGLIAHDILMLDRVFPSEEATAAIMRMDVSDRTRDRPELPVDLIQRWVTDCTKRPTFAVILRGANSVEFQLLSDRLPSMPGSDVAPRASQSPKATYERPRERKAAREMPASAVEISGHPGHSLDFSPLGYSSFRRPQPASLIVSACCLSFKL
jgi:hypothetical protein